MPAIAGREAHGYFAACTWWTQLCFVLLATFRHVTEHSVQLNHAYTICDVLAACGKPLIDAAAEHC